jgi:hypothetical protein
MKFLIGLILGFLLCWEGSNLLYIDPKPEIIYVEVEDTLKSLYEEPQPLTVQLWTTDYTAPHPEIIYWRNIESFVVEVEVNQDGETDYYLEFRRIGSDPEEDSEREMIPFSRFVITAYIEDES